MISVAEALERVIAGLKPLGTETVPLQQGLGRVLARDCHANLTYPPSAISAMDGYAVKASDTTSAPVTLNQIGASQAGGGFDGAIASGQCVRIFTGAPLPAGSDAIVMQENTEATDDSITVLEGVLAGTFVRPAGMDFSAGECLRAAGVQLSARDLGLLASANVAELEVQRRPRIAVLATGDELVMPGETPGPDQIISSNSIALAGYIEAFGGEAISLGIARDNADSLRACLGGMKDADMLITIGGASVGDYDLVRSVLGDEGMEMDFYKVAMRPGKPLIFGHMGGTPMLGLPGNPVSAGVTALLFLRPAMACMLGLDPVPDITATALLGSDLKANDRRQDYLRATLEKDSDGNLVATPFERQDSAMMANFARADCLVVRPPHAEPADKGNQVEIIVLSGATVSF